MRADSLQNSPYFAHVKNIKAVNLKCWSDGENKVQDCVRPAHFAEICHARSFRKKPTILQSIKQTTFNKAKKNAIIAMPESC